MCACWSVEIKLWWKSQLKFIQPLQSLTKLCGNTIKLTQKYRRSHNRVQIKKHIYHNISLISKSKTQCLIQECYMKANSFNLQSAEKRKNSSLRNETKIRFYFLLCRLIRIGNLLKPPFCRTLVVRNLFWARKRCFHRNTIISRQNKISQGKSSTMTRKPDWKTKKARKSKPNGLMI